MTQSNKDIVVEALRSIAEILIWGDQNDSSVFEFFLEKNMFQFFINLLNSEPGNNVCVQASSHFKLCLAHHLRAKDKRVLKMNFIDQ